MNSKRQTSPHQLRSEQLFPFPFQTRPQRNIKKVFIYLSDTVPSRPKRQPRNAEPTPSAIIYATSFLKDAHNGYDRYWPHVSEESHPRLSMGIMFYQRKRTKIRIPHKIKKQQYRHMMHTCVKKVFRTSKKYPRR